MVTRRDLLGTAAFVGGGLLAGCVAGSSGTDDTETPPPTDGPGGTDSGDTRPSGSGGPGVTLASVDRRPDLPIRPTVEVVDPVATDDHPPRLRVTVENGADRTVTLGEARAVVFEYVTSESGQLTTLPTGGDYPVAAGCWRLQEGIAVTADYRTVTLEPGEAHSSDLNLYGAPTDEDACLPAGEHRFESTYSVSFGGTEGENATGTGTGTGVPEEATWGFALLLE